jgi:uncharacterized protein YndB with AHSA1/START domain
MNLEFQVQMKIQKPVREVFDAVYNPEKLSGFFTTGSASAPLDEGTTVQWAFADNPGDENKRFPVKVEKMVPNKLILIRWEGAKDRETSVRMEFEESGDSETIVRISESGWRESQEDLDRSYMNCFGWGQFVCCLKAFAEYGINLRKGAFGGLYKSDAENENASSQSA